MNDDANFPHIGNVSIPYCEGHAKLARLLAAQVADELIAEYRAKQQRAATPADSDKEAGHE